VRCGGAVLIVSVRWRGVLPVGVLPVGVKIIVLRGFG